MVACLNCSKEFSSERSLNSHLGKKICGVDLNEYYFRHYPKYNLLTGKPMPFCGSLQKYLKRDFENKAEMEYWLSNSPTQKSKPWIINTLKSRVEEKGLKYAPCEFEVDTLDIPSILVIEKLFGSYEKACAEIGLEPLLKTSFERGSVTKSNPKIIIDTREQAPLNFPGSISAPLAFADYTLSGDDYNYTYVDRKSDSDFKGTFSTGIDRFKREMDKAISMDASIFVVIESSFEKAVSDVKFLKNGKRTLEYIFKNCRDLLHSYPRRIQFVFTGSRKSSQQVIPHILKCGKSIWDVDINLLIKRKNVG